MGGQFLPLGNMTFREPETFRNEVIRNVKASLERGLPTLEGFVDFQRQRPIALAAGGPSARKSIGKLREFSDIIACGTVHDWLINEGIEPRYAMIGDHHPIVAEYLKKPCEHTTYFVATQCDDAVFDALKDHKVVLWHVPQEWDDPEWPVSGMSVLGGGTIVLRAITLALMLGRKDVHFFGVDSCLGPDEAGYVFQELHNPTIDTNAQSYSVKLGKDEPGATEYRCLAWHLAQARDFAVVLQSWDFRPVFHGGGMISDMWSAIRADRERASVIRRGKFMANAAALCH